MSRRTEREKCHLARDAFFQCVDRLKSEESDQCTKLKQDFEAACPPSWVHHFVLQRQVYSAPPPEGVSAPGQ